MARTRRPSPTAILALAYLTLLAASHFARWSEAEPPSPRGPHVSVSAVDGAGRLERRVFVAYREWGERESSATPVVLLHGSPGGASQFEAMAPSLAARRRVLAPDLPGFGDSTRSVPDYSIRAHARYVLQWLDALGLDRVHVVGFSMGGGVGLEIDGLESGRVASLTLLSSIGVQELELFGDYRLNRAVHAAQLAGLVALSEGVPHFGALGGTLFDVPYARNFYDTDQRPLRGLLRRFEPPTLVLHGRDDFLVPLEAAVEHHRLVPQSELRILDGSHFLLFTEGERIGGEVAAFLERVDAGRAPRRADASANRLARSREPFDPRVVPVYSGFALVIVILLLALATLVSEDLACIGAGLLVAQGRIDFAPAVVGCFLGIFVGDMLLFFAGRVFGRPALRRAPLRWLVREDTVELSSRWFQKRGAIVIGLSRFLPGTRAPTYFAAGMLRTSFRRFAGWFFLAVAVWTPLLVGGAWWAGERAFAWFALFRHHALWALPLLGLCILIVVKLLLPLLSFSGRRRFVGRWRRLSRWEFWPPWAFYPPVVLYVIGLGLRHRSLLLFTAANPAMPAGGFIAESKREILAALAGASERVAAWRFLPASLDAAEREREALAFMDEQGLDWPLVLKPDVGQRGSGVAIVRDRIGLRDYLAAADYDCLAQEYVPGVEFGVFYVRMPGEERGRIFSITDKRNPVLIGDGDSTVETLILRDPRAVCVADLYCAMHRERLFETLPAGERLSLGELGTHCRGAIFLDGRRLATEPLTDAIDAISRSYAGFWFGRYDVRVKDAETLAAGGPFKVIELNGVTSEATHIYDPAIGVFEAWRTLFEQWRLAFEIGARNRARGVRPASLRELFALVMRYRRVSRGHPA